MPGQTHRHYSQLLNFAQAFRADRRIVLVEGAVGEAMQTWIEGVLCSHASESVDRLVFEKTVNPKGLEPMTAKIEVFFEKLNGEQEENAVLVMVDARALPDTWHGEQIMALASAVTVITTWVDVLTRALFTAANKSKLELTLGA